MHNLTTLIDNVILDQRERKYTDTIELTSKYSDIIIRNQYSIHHDINTIIIKVNINTDKIIKEELKAKRILELEAELESLRVL